MQNKMVLLYSLLNIIVGNSILFFTGMGALLTSFIGGSNSTLEQLLLHIICSAVATVFIISTVKFIKSKPRGFIVLGALSLVGSVSVPLLSTYLLFAGYNCLINKFSEFNSKALFIAAAATSFSAHFWGPIAVANFSFFILLNGTQRNMTANNDA
jgi:hypothetical protein